MILYSTRSVLAGDIVNVGLDNIRIWGREEANIGRLISLVSLQQRLTRAAVTRSKLPSVDHSLPVRTSFYFGLQDRLTRLEGCVYSCQDLIVSLSCDCSYPSLKPSAVCAKETAVTKLAPLPLTPLLNAYIDSSSAP